MKHVGPLDMAPAFNEGSRGKMQILHEKLLLGIQHTEMISVALYTLKSLSKSSFNRDNSLTQIYISFECLVVWVLSGFSLMLAFSFVWGW